MKSIIEILKSPNAVLGVLALALLAQMPHAADVFRMTVHSAQTADASIWEKGHSYSYAIALELAVLLFVIQNRHIESYGFAAVSVLVNLSYYGLHGVNLFHTDYRGCNRFLFEISPRWMPHLLPP
jgi:hypothetical protein